MTNTTAINALDLALTVARAEGRPVRSVKDLLCDGCGVAVALAAGGLCHACNADVAAYYDGTLDVSAAPAGYDGSDLNDDEAACYCAGIEPAKY